MGNSHLHLYWSRLQPSSTSPLSPAPDSLTFTSPDTYREYRVTHVLNEDQALYLAQDVSGTNYRLKYFQFDDFSLVKILRKRVNFIRQHQRSLHTLEIVDIIEAPPMDNHPWLVAVVTALEDSICMDELLKNCVFEQIGMEKNTRFAMEDVIKSLNRVLESVDIFHQFTLPAGPIPLNSLQIVKKRDSKFKVKIDFLHSQNAIFSSEVSEKSRDNDLKDIGIALLSVLLMRSIPLDPTMDLILSIPYPSLLKTVLLKLIKPISRLTETTQVHTSDSFLLLMRLIRGEKVDTVAPNHALVYIMALECRRIEVKIRAFRLLLQVVLKYPEMRNDASVREICPYELTEVLDRFSYESDRELISPLFEVLTTVVGVAGQVAGKKAGLMKSVLRCMQGSGGEHGLQEYFPAVLRFCRGMDCTSCYRILATKAPPVILTSSPTPDTKKFILETCHRYGDLTLGLITTLIEHRLLSSPFETLSLLFKVPVHLYKPGIPIEIAHLLCPLLNLSDDLQARFELVTEFLCYTQQQHLVWSNYILLGRCLTADMATLPGGIRVNEYGYHCSTCNLHLCITCMSPHTTHLLTYIPSISKCQALGTQPLFTQLTHRTASQVIFTSKDSIQTEILRGPGIFTAGFSVEMDEKGPEDLGFYIEIMIRDGGTTDSVEVILGEELRFNTQDGLIKYRGKETVGPCLSSSDVVGVGFTSHSQVLFTFNGLPYPVLFLYPELHSTGNVTISLACHSEVSLLPFKQHLFQPSLSLQPTVTLLQLCSKVKLPRYIWSHYKKAYQLVKHRHCDCRYLPAAKLFLAGRKTHEQAPVHSQSCNCCVS